MTEEKSDACWGCKVIWKRSDMFICECGYQECPGCWFKRTGGYGKQELMTPFWICPRCEIKIILDHDGNHITTLGGPLYGD